VTLRFWVVQAAAPLALVLVDAGRVTEAADVLAAAEAEVTAESALHQRAILDHALATVAWAQGRFGEATHGFLAAGERLAPINSLNPAALDWRSPAALALAGTGERQRARRLSAEAVALARRFGAARAVGVALRADALVQESVSVDALGEAAAVLASSPARLEHARVLVDYGAALRRGGRRREAREPLLEGMDAAARCGAAPLVARAREELLAAGARPRRVLRRGADALTASERRIARMAADGRSNPEIAQALFVTVRTVESHLGHVYRKLDIAGREALAERLAVERS
jgi:DNA-binding CsgD family transcriptional regulator